MPEACPGIPHPTLGFPMAVEVCRVRPGCLPWAQSRRSESVRCRDSARSRTAYAQEMLRTAIALSFRRHCAPGRPPGPSARSPAMFLRPQGNRRHFTCL